MVSGLTIRRLRREELGVKNSPVSTSGAADVPTLRWRRSWSLGWLHLRATENGLSDLSIARSSDGVEDALDAFMSDESEINYEILAKESPSLASVVRHANDALTRYLDEDLSDPDAFVDVPVDLSGLTSFGRTVLETLRGVKAGELITYGALAQTIGSPHSARAVGGAVGANPLLIAIPCHRVVAADGSLGGFSAGLGVKRWLLAHEGVAARPGGWESRRRPVS